VVRVFSASWWTYQIRARGSEGTLTRSAPQRGTGDKAGDASAFDQPLEASLAGALRKDHGWNRLRRNLLGLSSYLLQIVVRVLMHTQCEIGTPSR
jgi:hypothetical protein